MAVRPEVFPRRDMAWVITADSFGCVGGASPHPGLHSQVEGHWQVGWWLQPQSPPRLLLFPVNHISSFEAREDHCVGPW